MDSELINLARRLHFWTGRFLKVLGEEVATRQDRYVLSELAGPELMKQWKSGVLSTGDFLSAIQKRIREPRKSSLALLAQYQWGGQTWYLTGDVGTDDTLIQAHARRFESWETAGKMASDCLAGNFLYEIVPVQDED